MVEEEYKTEATRALEGWCNDHPVTIEWKDHDADTKAGTYLWSEVCVVLKKDPSFIVCQAWGPQYLKYGSIIGQRDHVAKDALKQIREINIRVKEHKRTLALVELLEPPKKKKKAEV
jgi:hypothetical protein